MTISFDDFVNIPAGSTFGDAGKNGGLATLDINGHLPVAQMPFQPVVWEGYWNAATNTPQIVSGVGTRGYQYTANVAGTTLIDGVSQWNVGDSLTFNGTVWQKSDGNPTEVISVAGQVGIITVANLVTAGLAPINNAAFTGSTVTARNILDNGSGYMFLQGTSLISGYASALTIGYAGAGAEYGITLKPTVDGTTAIAILNSSSGLSGSINQTASSISVTSSGALELAAGNGTGYALLNSSGNFGLGSTPSPWGATYKVTQSGNAYYGFNSGYTTTDIPVIGTNTYYNGSGDIYLSAANAASRYYQANGIHYFNSAVPAAAGNTVVWETPLTVSSTGSAGGIIGLGTTPGNWAPEAAVAQFSNGFGAAGSLTQGPRNHVFLSTNAVATGSGDPGFTTWEYANNGYAQLLQMGWSIGLQVNAAPSGIGGNAIAWTTVLSVDNSGNMSTPGTVTAANATVSTELVTLGQMTSAISTSATSANPSFSGTVTISNTATPTFSIQGIQTLGTPNEGVYNGYLLLAKAYTTGNVAPSWVEGTFYVQRGSISSGNRSDTYTVTSKTAFTSDSFYVDATVLSGEAFITRTVTVNYGGTVYHAIETTLTGGHPDEGILFAGTINNCAPIYVDASYVTAVTPYGGYSIKTATNSGGLRSYFDGAGNLGLGVIPYSWNASGNIGIDLGPYASLASEPSFPTFDIASNLYNNGVNWIYKNAGAGSIFRSTQGEFQWYSSPVGIVGNAAPQILNAVLSTTGTMTLTGEIVANSQATIMPVTNSTGINLIANPAGAYIEANPNGLGLNKILIGGNSYVSLAELAVNANSTALTGGLTTAYNTLDDGSGNATFAGNITGNLLGTATTSNGLKGEPYNDLVSPPLAYMLQSNGSGNGIYMISTTNYVTVNSSPTLGTLTLTGTVKTAGYTVATLPPGLEGMRTYVTDAVNPSFTGTLTGGGTVVTPVMFNGTAWVSESGGGGSGSITAYTTNQTFAVPGTYATLAAAMTAFENAVWLDNATCQIQIAQGTTLSEQITRTSGDYSKLSIVALGTGITVNTTSFVVSPGINVNGFLTFENCFAPNIVGTITLSSSTVATVVGSACVINLAPISGTSGLTTNGYMLLFTNSGSISNLNSAASSLTVIRNCNVSNSTLGVAPQLTNCVLSLNTFITPQLTGCSSSSDTFIGSASGSMYFVRSDISGAILDLTACTTGYAIVMSNSFSLQIQTLKMPATAQTFDFYGASTGSSNISTNGMTATGTASTGKRYALGTITNAGALISSFASPLLTYFTGGDSQTINTITANGLILGS